MLFTDTKTVTYIDNKVIVDGTARDIATTCPVYAVQFHSGRDYLLEEPLMEKVAFSKYQFILDEWVAAEVIIDETAAEVIIDETAAEVIIDETAVSEV